VLSDCRVTLEDDGAIRLSPGRIKGVVFERVRIVQDADDALLYPDPDNEGPAYTVPVELQARRTG
jgi:hypothetical protein